MHSDFVKILARFKRQYGEEKGERLFYAWLNKHDLDPDKAYNIQAQFNECMGGICEAFNWVEKDLISFYKSDDEAKYYKAKALTANVSMNMNDYRDVIELAKAAPTLGWRRLNMNHDHSKWLPFPDARVDYAAFEDNAVEAILRIPHYLKEIQMAIDNGDILHVSIEGEPRAGAHTDEGRAPRKYTFTALALLEKDVTLPGDPLTYLEPLFLNESMGRSLVESLSNVEQPKEEEKMSEDKDEKKLTEAEARNESCAQCSRFLEKLPTTTKTDKVDASEPSDGHILTREGGIGAGVGECQVSKQLVRKNDAACTDWRQRDTPTSADNVERTYEGKVESVEEIIMKKEKEDLENELLTTKRKHNDELISHVTTRGDLVEAQRKIATKDKEIAIHVAKIGRLESKYEDVDRKLDKALTVAEELKVKNDDLESDSKFMKDTLKRKEDLVDADRKDISQLKNALAEALTKQNDESAKRAEAVQRAQDAVSREAKVLQDNAILSEDLAADRQKVYDLSQRNAEYAREILKLQREKTELKEKYDKQTETIRALKRKIGKPPKVHITTVKPTKT